MHIAVNTDNHIHGSEKLAGDVESIVEASLARFSGRITRVEVHLSDENGPKKGSDDIRCAMEARLVGLKPIAVTHHAAEVDDAVSGAAEKLVRAVDHTLGRLNA